jgi:hypothetical protein
MGNERKDTWISEISGIQERITLQSRHERWNRRFAQITQSRSPASHRLVAQGRAKPPGEDTQVTTESLQSQNPGGFEGRSDRETRRHDRGVSERNLRDLRNLWFTKTGMQRDGVRPGREALLNA